MIYEFALDPNLAAQWSDRREFQRYAGKFGIGTTRIMSRVPNKHWRRMVWKAFDALGLEGPEQDMRRKKLENILVASLEAGTAGRFCGDDRPWFELAVRQHARRPFRALLVASGAPQANDVPVLRDPDFEEDDPIWSPEHRLVPRTPEALAEALAPLLSCAKWVRFVDPHFAPKQSKWRRTIVLLLARAVAGREVEARPAVEIHTCVSRGRGMRPLEGQTTAEQEEKARELAASLDALVPSVPAGLPLKAYFWAERVDAADFHDRFVLTDVGGLHLGKGLDAADREVGRRDETITVLPRGLYADLVSRYAATSPDFDARGARTVVGAASTAPSIRR